MLRALARFRFSRFHDQIFGFIASTSEHHSHTSQATTLLRTKQLSVRGSRHSRTTNLSIGPLPHSNLRPQFENGTEPSTHRLPSHPRRCICCRNGLLSSYPPRSQRRGQKAPQSIDGARGVHAPSAASQFPSDEELLQRARHSTTTSCTWTFLRASRCSS